MAAAQLKEQQQPFLLNSLDNGWRVFCWTSLISFLVKVYLAHLVPITGDEAEYIYWGQHFSWGYYEHPPLIGWILAFWNQFGLSNIWVRMPQIIASNLIAVLMYVALKRIDEKKAVWVSLIYLLSPVSLFNIAILTDTPLMIFSFLGVFCLMMAEQGHGNKYYLFAGLGLGAAYFSKYLMLPIAIGVLLYFLFSKEIKNRWLKLLATLVFALPFFIENVWWNYSNNWVNLLFNLDLRNEGDHLNWHLLAKYLVFIIYLYSPVMVYIIVRHAKKLSQGWANLALRVALLTGLATILFYGVLSISKSIGLHWIFCGYAFLFMPLILLEVKKIKRLFKWMLFYSGVQLIVVLIVFHLPLSFWKKTSVYDSVNWFLNYERIYPVVEPYMKKGFIFMTPSYAQSYLTVYRHKKPAAVWGIGSVNGRPDDFFSNFKDFNHKNIVIVSQMDPFYRSEYLPYFKKVDFYKKEMLGSPYYLVVGYDFNYDAYRQTILTRIYQEFYDVKLLKLLPRQGDFYKDKYNL
ncbi:dolichyl-phosphate-mannose-protein mannosyltransferase [Piscirickettsia salmonis]|uniref:Membrane protein n=1 Tax=Piscirickettsia salmonis TaxID=1238 RepID=A0A9Q5V817_PISSA|nr:glycosyltransferase family 39 protein [Piscirickettsia salmonis]RNC78629.1 dolichyl-phosphate-mannose-protein mannosyltransferase [Piscirickettsiaceae bacterium NZ-RLO2]ALA24630.1 dolichyl-phosphate-mannose-mannosyltransferase family protein [Piscirickettsia salmonis]APS44978.1 dolichyl-phosphate-mannose-protein mannosyltransferase [Piscirickettsia salmonis]APS48338.1 dolichyl-phosphate-mannose-protein mannosyltransferase [Piscirickettsia salmonis]APS49596.1 dolichyl-phosphate-mannose-prote